MREKKIVDLVVDQLVGQSGSVLDQLVGQSGSVLDVAVEMVAEKLERVQLDLKDKIVQLETAIPPPPVVELSPVSDISKENEEPPLYRIVPIAGKGFGMLANRRIFPGEIIIAEKPLIVLPDEVYEDVEASEVYVDKIVSRMSSDHRRQFLDLTDCRNPLEPSYLGIFYTNDMNYDGDAALFPVMARANHSCIPNAEFVSRRDLGVQRLVAMYPIQKDEEILICYMSVAEEASDIREVRQAYMREWYGFQCVCAVCTLKDEDLEANEKLREEIKQLQSAGLENLTIPELEDLIQSMYQIQGKLSYILDLFDQLYRRSTEDVIGRFRYGVSGYALAVQVHGHTSQIAGVWRERKEVEQWDVVRLASRWG